ncbi:MAG TPA: gamma carbonic anhydrase family protein [Spirochaetota bacterium]|nr:gamma carbonic anhydrase family protein [Spirochaetota bacterium]HPQ54734.1 gamma carbonic anhydrase family protein [Spirochaetota bacterium]
MKFRLGERMVTLAGEDAYIAKNATVIGSVTLGNNASIWFNAVVRGDSNTISIGENTNIQDSCVCHTEEANSLTIGDNVTVGHKAMLHGCTIGSNCLIGINAVVLNGAVIGDNCIIGANALVTEGREIPAGSLVLGSPGKVVRQITDEEKRTIAHSAVHYVENFRRYRRELQEEFEE